MLSSINAEQYENRWYFGTNRSWLPGHQHLRKNRLLFLLSATQNNIRSCVPTVLCHTPCMNRISWSYSSFFICETWETSKHILLHLLHIQLIKIFSFLCFFFVFCCCGVFMLLFVNIRLLLIHNLLLFFHSHSRRMFRCRYF